MEGRVGIVVSNSDVGRYDFKVVGELFSRSQEGNPEWHIHFDDVDPISADRDDVAQLMDTAPTGFTRGYMKGIVAIRQQLAIVSGRPFDTEVPIQWDFGGAAEINQSWAEQVNDMDPITVSREILTHYLETAPCEEAAGILAGILMFRTQISICTEISF